MIQLVIVLAFLSSLIATAILWLTAGNSLGLWLGGPFVIVLIVPLVAVYQQQLKTALLGLLFTLSGVVVPWFIAAILSHVPISHWLACSVVLASVSLTANGLTRFLCSSKLPFQFAAMVTTLLLICWLISPILLSPWMNDRIAHSLSTFHPLLALNSKLTSLGIWLEHGVVYRHTVLGQDVPYTLPSSTLPSVLMHTGLGIALLSVVEIFKRVKSKVAHALL